MTVSFIDSPGALASTTETIDFTTDRLVTSISVEFNPGASTGFRETVFDGTSDVDNSGGDFSNLYRTSTRSGSGPYTWAIRRSGKWPAPFRIRVKEEDAPVVPPTGQLWEAIYEVDFTDLPGQTIGAAGSYTIDGKTWWAKGAKSASHTSTEIAVEVGLRFSVAGSLGYQPAGDYPGGGFGTQLLFMPLAQITNWNPNAPTCLQFRLDSTTVFPPGSIAAISGGLIGAASNSSPFADADRGSQAWLGSDTSNRMSAFAAADFYTNPITTESSNTLSDHVYTLTRVDRRVHSGTHKLWTGSWPDPGGAFTTYRALLATQDPTNLGVAFLLNSQTTWQYQVTNMRISQPRQ